MDPGSSASRANAMEGRRFEDRTPPGGYGVGKEEKGATAAATATATTAAAGSSQPVQYVQHEYHPVGGRNPKRVAIRKSQKKVSAFILKLFNMLHDPSLSSLIWWSRVAQNDSVTFALVPGAQFSQCLSVYFKHSNVASFVRQLHMYGFHKVSDLPVNGTSSHSVWEFRHSLGQFKKGDAESLQWIKRRNNSRKNPQSRVEVDLPSTNHVSADARHHYNMPHHTYQVPAHVVYSPQPAMVPPQTTMGYPQRIPSPPGLRRHPQQKSHMNPVFADNVFYGHPGQRNRYPSLLVDPCAPTSAPPLPGPPLDDQARYEQTSHYAAEQLRSRSEPLVLPHQHHQPPYLDDRLSTVHRSLPHLHATPPPPPSTLHQQMRPSIFALHQQQYSHVYPSQQVSGSIASTRDSVFSHNNMSISSVGGRSVASTASFSTVVSATTKHPALEHLLNNEPTNDKIKELPDISSKEESSSEPGKSPTESGRVSPSDIALKQ